MKKKPGSITWNATMEALSALTDDFEFKIGRWELLFLVSNWYKVGKLIEQVFYVDIHDMEMRVNDV